MTQEEKTLARWHIEKMKDNQKYFEYADISQNILEQQKDDDLLLLQDWLTEVHNKLKPDDKRRKEVLMLIQGVWRIEKYCGGLETVAKASTVRVHTLTKRNEELESDIRKLNLELKLNESRYQKQIINLEKEIEFVAKNG